MTRLFSISDGMIITLKKMLLIKYDHRISVQFTGSCQMFSEVTPLVLKFLNATEHGEEEGTEKEGEWRRMQENQRKCKG